MQGQWAADPYGRAELRWWDGSQWTNYVSNRGVAGWDTPFPVAAPQPANPTFAPPGQLVAAGVMTIVESAIALVIGLWLFSLTTTRIGGLADDLSGGALTLIALLTVAVGVTLLVAGIGACRARAWARITIIVLHAITAVLCLLGAIGAATSDPTRRIDGTVEARPTSGLVFGLLWFGTIILLAALGRPRQRSAAVGAPGTAYGPPRF